MMPSLVIPNPVLPLVAITLLSPLVLAYAISFIDPLHRLKRASILLLLIAVAAQLQYSVPVFTGNGTYDGMFMSLIWIFHLRAFDLLLWKAVYSSAMTVPKLQQSQFSPARSRFSRLFTSWCLLFNFRNINTSWTVKGVPNFSDGNPGYVPNKHQFVKRRTAHILVTYLILDVLFAFLPPPNLENDVPEHKEPLFSRIGDITLEEIIARPISVLIPAFSIYSIFNIPYNLASITSVLLCGSEPKDWPPLFGNFREGYTLRRLWGKTWHQLLRSSLEASTSFLATHVLCIPPHYKNLSRYVRLHLAFFITALVHLPGVVILGESPFTMGVPKFFLMQAVGILIESTALKFWVAISKVTTNEAPAGRTVKLMGYVWVLAWITWTGPSFTWLVARALVQGKDDVVPWSFIKWLGYAK